MSETGLSVVTSVFSAASAAFGTSPLGPVDLPAIDLSQALATADPAWVVTVDDPNVGSVDFFSGAETGLPLSAYPQNFLNAVIAAEDGRFQEHEGADPVGLAAAVMDTMRGNVRGGSSITQQLMKNAVVGNEQTLNRKLAELVLSVRAESRFSKSEILEAYLNHAWFGRGAQGAAHAPKVWFNKDWSELTLSESATLAAMLKGPARFDPYKNPEMVQSRRDLVLKRMHVYGWISDEDLNTAIKEKLIAVAPVSSPVGDTWLLSALRRGAEEFMNRTKRSDYEARKITSTLSPDWQSLAEAAVKKAKLPKNAEAAVIIMRIPDGDLLATVGGVDSERSGYDRTFAMRQPGSLGKPLFYAGALDLGMTPWDLVRNDPIDWGGTWSPKNYDGSITGPAPLYQGLEASSNLMTVHLADSVNMDELFRIAQQSGAWRFGDIQPYGPSLLGASETSLRRITMGLAGLANEGRTVPLRTFYEDAPAPITFISESSANYVLSMMRGVMVRGTASLAGNRSKVPLAGKTGTSQDHRDAWFVGLTPHIAIGVWVGRDDDKSLGDGTTGGVVSADIAIGILNAALEKNLITSTGFVPDAFISAHADWPPPLLSPEAGGAYVSNTGGHDRVVQRNRPERPGDDQVDAFINQLDNVFWSIPNQP